MRLRQERGSWKQVGFPRSRFGFFVLILLAAAVGFVLRSETDRILNSCVDSAYTLLNPLLHCVPASTKTFVPEYEDFSADLQQWVDQEKVQKKIDVAAVYFRDLNSGSWFGINERETFVPASLFKLPVMIAYLKASEQIPTIFTEKVEMSGAYNGLNNVADPSQTILPGKLYTVDELLHRMIAFSDNASTDVLRNHLDQLDPTGNAVRNVYSQIGMLNAYQQHALTVKEYSTLFRILYNARFVSPEMSQKGLDLLTQSIYRDALVAGVPTGTVVAHKFGIREVPTELLKQLHDCGIVYHPLRPYILCVMTRSTRIPESVALIKEVSKRVYDEVTAHVRK